MNERGLFRRRVLAWVGRIPEGRIATYGQIARLAGYPRRARQVGYILARLPPEHGLPWHRVINVRGRVSTRAAGPAGEEGGAEAESRQQRLLGAEGIVFRQGRSDLQRYQWHPEMGGEWESPEEIGEREGRGELGGE